MWIISEFIFNSTKLANTAKITIDCLRLSEGFESIDRSLISSFSSIPCSGTNAKVTREKNKLNTIKQRSDPSLYMQKHFTLALSLMLDKPTVVKYFQTALWRNVLAGGQWLGSISLFGKKEGTNKQNKQITTNAHKSMQNKGLRQFNKGLLCVCLANKCKCGPVNVIDMSWRRNARARAHHPLFFLNVWSH